MDAQIISDNSFLAANPSEYSLTETWPSPVIGNGGVGNQSGGGLGLRMSINHDVSADESAITEQRGSRGGGGGRKRSDAGSEDEFSKVVSTRSGNDLGFSACFSLQTWNNKNNSNDKRMKISGSREENGGLKSEVQANSEPGINPAEQSTKPSEPLKQDYIHVRARRGQATDSHSLAERARREKISERMKILQDLVPGCNKVVGKALVLDEIINYILSLQRQVEFLSMKLEAVNSSMNSPIERFLSKDLGVPTFDASKMIIGTQAMREYMQGSQHEWLHMQVSASFDKAA